MTDSSQLILSLILIKGLVQNSLQAWDTMSDVLSISSDSPYRSLWRDKNYFCTLLNPTQTVLCTGHKARFLKYLFGDLQHVFSMDMSQIFYNATTMKGAFTFADISLGYRMWNSGLCKLLSNCSNLIFERFQISNFVT